MPRRPTPLRPEDGPGQRFALKLRALRDKLGAGAPTVDEVSQTTGVSRATIYAALNGRIPSRPVLSAIVGAWGGNESQWLAMRRSAEAELEEMRRGRRSPGNAKTGQKRVGQGSASRQRNVTPDSAIANPAVQDFARALRDLRVAAGNPSLEDISDWHRITRGHGERRTVPYTTLWYLMRGLRFPYWHQVEAILPALRGDVEAWRVRWLAMARTTELDEDQIRRVEQAGRR